MKGICSVLILFGFNVCFADTMVTGKIDDLKNQALANVQVTLVAKGISLKQTTDKKGHFSFQNVKPGLYRLSASKYTMLTYTENVKVQNKKQSVNIDLLPVAIATYHYLPQTHASYF